MTDTIKARSTIIGTQYTILAGRKRYPVTILFSGNPLIVMGQSLTPISSPQRFGSWDTPRAQRAYVRAFVADWDAAEDRFDAIPCSVCGQPGDPCACD